MVPDKRCPLVVTGIASVMYYLTGIWGIGVATRNCDVQKVPLGCDSDSWVLRHDGSLCHSDTEVSRLAPLPEEGDVIVRKMLLVLKHLSLRIDGCSRHYVSG